jgi:hypothetical protein
VSDETSRYEGIPLSELLVDEIDWFYAGEHIRTRTKRYPDKPEFDVEPEWATEAALDPGRLVSTTGGKSIEVIGLSASAPNLDGTGNGRVLKVWLVPKDLSRGSWWGSSACDGSRKNRNAYERHKLERSNE